MITAMLMLVGGSVLGALWAHPAEKRLQCGAQIVYKKYVGETNCYQSVEADRTKRCKERVDARCLGGNCTLHCRDQNRCNGTCLDT